MSGVNFQLPNIFTEKISQMDSTFLYFGDCNKPVGDSVEGKPGFVVNFTQNVSVRRRGRSLSPVVVMSS